MQGFPLRMTDRDSWSGPEESGFWVFNSNARRAAWLKEEYAKRTGPTPEFYVDYNAEQPIELTKEHTFDNEGKFYAAKLFETKRVQLV